MSHNNDPLRRFVAFRRGRNAIDDTWVADGYEWATDGYVLARRRTIEANRTPEGIKVPPVENVWEGPDSFETDSLPLVEVPYLVACEKCDGFGEVTSSRNSQHECAQCGGRGLVEQNDAIHWPDRAALSPLYVRLDNSSL